MELVICAGVIWEGCVTAEVERIAVSSYEDALDHLAAWLEWLPSERARQVAELALAGQTALAGWACGDTIVADPPEQAEKIDLSRYGHGVYVVPGNRPSDAYPDIMGDVWEPFYIDAWIDEE